MKLASFGESKWVVLSPLTPAPLGERIRFADLVRHALDSFAVTTTAANASVLILLLVPIVLNTAHPRRAVHTGLGVELVGAAHLAILLTISIGETGGLVVVHLVFRGTSTVAEAG